MEFIHYIFWIIASIILLFIVYLYFLAFISLLPRKKRKLKYPNNTRFAIIIPAHNEAKVIQKTLTSLKSLDYPKNSYDIIVICDNCDDNTAQIVQRNEIRFFERVDKNRKGKGYALQWLFDKIKDDTRYDAFVIIDADSIVAPNLLSILNQKICEGARAIQSFYDVINPEKSPMASLSYLGFLLSRNLRYKGRERLGWSTNLLGNGMCFSRDIISKYGWNATSIVEDLEYGIMLHLNGVRVHFASEAKIYAEIPATFRDAKIQRTRWDIGKFHIRNKYALKLLKRWILKKDISFLDSALELLIPPYSLLLAVCFVLFGLFMLVSFDVRGLLFYLWLTIICSLILYTLLGLIVGKAKLDIYRNLVYAPFFIIWRIVIVVKGLLVGNKGRWIKTQRKNSHNQYGLKQKRKRSLNVF